MTLENGEGSNACALPCGVGGVGQGVSEVSAMRKIGQLQGQHARRPYSRPATARHLTHWQRYSRLVATLLGLTLRRGCFIGAYYSTDEGFKVFASPTKKRRMRAERIIAQKPGPWCWALGGFGRTPRRLQVEPANSWLASCFMGVQIYLHCNYQCGLTVKSFSWLCRLNSLAL